MAKLPFMLESANSKVTDTVGSYHSVEDSNDFDTIFSEAYESLKAGDCDIKRDATQIITNDNFYEAYKNAILQGVQSFVEDKTWEEHGTVASLYDQISTQFDNRREALLLESTTAGQLLPIKMVDFPLIVKDHLKNILKDIMQSEVVNSPLIKKHIQRTWIINKQTGERYEYPQCFYREGQASLIYDAGKGYKLDPTPVTLPAFNYDIITNLVPSITNAAREKISMNTKIVKVITTNDFEMNVDMRINLSDGAWLNGIVKGQAQKDDGAGNITFEDVNDCITGNVDFITNTTSISCAGGTIKAVVMAGYLSNDLNERTVTFDYTREEREWKIEDGSRANIPYSIEDLEEAKALLDLDLYKMTYSNVADYLSALEDATGIDYMNAKFTEFETLSLDPLEWNGFVKTTTFDCDSTIATTALPCEYIEKQLKFNIDRFVIAIADTAKLEDVTFVIYGNPRYVSLLGASVNWVVKNGDSVGGVKSTYSYGIMNSGGVKIQVVSSDKINVPQHKGLRVVPYPISKTKMTHKHYAFTKHILDGRNDKYRDADRPGGSYTNLMAVSRYTNASLQAIQGQINFINDEQYINV